MKNSPVAALVKQAARNVGKVLHPQDARTLMVVLLAMPEGTTMREALAACERLLR